jgi:hypothetical protein
LAGSERRRDDGGPALGPRHDGEQGGRDCPQGEGQEGEMRIPWREAIVVAGVCLVAYGGSGLSGYLDGSLANGEGPISAWFSYADDERLEITAGTALMAIGAFMYLSRAA